MEQDWLIDGFNKFFYYLFFQKSSIESKPENGESDKSATELEEGEVEPATHDESSSPVPENFYDKKKSFFDTISCEGMLNFCNMLKVFPYQNMHQINRKAL